MLGGCFAPPKFLDDDALLSLAISSEMTHLARSYVSEAGFVAANPDCCEVSRWRDPQGAVTLFSKLYRYATTVRLEYRIRNTEKSASRKSTYVIDACGRTVDYTG